MTAAGTVNRMIGLALLRGINVGGANKIEMARLRSTFQAIGLSNVRTYIASGNVVFSDRRPHSELAPMLEEAIAEEFGLNIKILLRDMDAMTALVEALPDHWIDDKLTRCYVMFLWEEVDDAGVVDSLKLKEDIDEVIYVPGALIWRVDHHGDRKILGRSGMNNIMATPLYRAITIRNANTVRKLAAMMSETNEVASSK